MPDRMPPLRVSVRTWPVLARVFNLVDLGAYEYQGSGSPQLKITGQPAPLSYCQSGANQFAVSAGGFGLTYLWQANHNDGQGFVSANGNAAYSGATSPILTVNNASSPDDGTLFRCVVTSSSGCSINSAAAPLEIHVARWYVNASAAAGGDGTSWGRAFRTLDAALYLAFQPCNNEIWVAQGSYTPTSGAYAMPANVAIYGGFTGVETNLAQRNWQAFPAILDGHKTAQFLIFNESAQPIGPTARLDGFILQNASYYALYNYQGQKVRTVANCTFRSNTINGVINYRSSPHFLTNCVFLQNGATTNQLAGAIQHYGSGDSLLMEDCVFQGNMTASDGAGITTYGGDVTLVNCLFSGNYAVSNGAAVFAADLPAAPYVGGFVTLRNCTFSGNHGGGVGGRCDG